MALSSRPPPDREFPLSILTVHPSFHMPHTTYMVVSRQEFSFLPTCAISVHRYMIVLSERGRAYSFRIRVTGASSLPQTSLLDHSLPHRFPYARPSVVPLLPKEFSCCTGKPYAGSHTAAISFFATKNGCDTFFSSFCRSVFPCLFPGIVILPFPAFRVGFTTPIFHHPQSPVSLSLHSLLFIHQERM